MPRRWKRIGPVTEGPAPRSVEAHLLAFQVLERVDLGAHEHVQLGDVHLGDEVHAPLDVGNLVDRPEMLEHVGMRDGDIHTL
jgi:hypothetical protein